MNYFDRFATVVNVVYKSFLEEKFQEEIEISPSTKTAGICRFKSELTVLECSFT